VEFPHGWEAHVYRLRVEGEEPLPLLFDKPLSLRAYDTPHALPRARHEFAVLKRMRALGYPVAAPLLLEEDSHLLGGPFLILPWVEGITLVDWLRNGFTRILAVARRLAGLHVMLHELPCAEAWRPGAPFLDRRLDELATMIRDYGLDDLGEGLSWLETHRPPEPDRGCILHLDFHPINIVVDDTGAPRTVLDWSEADVGDRHADVAMTLVLLRTAPVAAASFSERLLSRPARWLLARRYLRVYRRSVSLDPVRLRYYLAWASLRRLAVSSTWRRVGPWVHGFKTSAVQYSNEVHESALRGVFAEATGIRLENAELAVAS
jgi:aminoglycoside phosphotransferase (APT) family kinase protein